MERSVAYRQLKITDGEADDWTQKVLSRVIQLYDDWGRPEEAERFRTLRIEANVADEPDAD